MKNRTIAFTLALCLISSFALADNPSDAALVADDTSSVAAPQEGRAASMKQHRSKKETSSPKRMAEGSSASGAKKAAKDCERSAKTSASSAL